MIPTVSPSVPGVKLEPEKEIPLSSLLSTTDAEDEDDSIPALDSGAEESEDLDEIPERHVSRQTRVRPPQLNTSRNLPQDVQSRVTPPKINEDSFEIEPVTKQPDQAIVQVCKKECLDCKHLTIFGSKFYQKCHYSAGNELCPAASVQIIQHIPMDKIVHAYRTALQEGDMARISRIYSMLSKKPSFVQKRVQAELDKIK